MRLLAALFVFALVAAAPDVHANTTPSSQLDSLWESAFHALSQENYSGAIELMNQWRQLAAQSGVNSPELHYNLGIGYLNLKQTGLGVFHLLKSANLSGSPFRIWKTLDNISEIQRQLGVKDNLADATFLRLSFLVNHNVLWIILMASVWALVTSLILFWWQRHFSVTAQLLSAFAVVSLALATAGWINTHLYCRFGVLTGSTERVSVYSSPQKKKEQLLVDLPSGTVVNLSDPVQQSTPITEPFAGWVNSEEVTVLR